MIGVAFEFSEHKPERLRDPLLEMLCILFVVFFLFDLLILATLKGFVAFLPSFARRNVKFLIFWSEVLENLFRQLSLLFPHSLLLVK